MGLRYKGQDIASMAERISELEAQLAETRELLKDSRDELEHYIDNEYPYRHDYPHMMAKWDCSIDIVRRIDKALSGEEWSDGEYNCTARTVRAY